MTYFLWPPSVCGARAAGSEGESEGRASEGAREGARAGGWLGRGEDVKENK